MSHGPAQEENATLLWTGGWDSTFRLLQLLINHRRCVQPFYLIDAERLSTGIEIRTMRRIKTLLFSERPYTRELLGPTTYVEVADVPPDDEIGAAFQQLRNEYTIGGQYEWLARFCRQMGFSRMELCVHGDVSRILGPFVSEYRTDREATYRITSTQSTDSVPVVFGRFQFPLLGLSKLQMATIAAEQDWTHVMRMTWFCHRPRGGELPCGICNPCNQAIEEGLGWRIPARRRAMARVYRAVVRPSRRHSGRIVRWLRGRGRNSSGR